MNRARRRAGTWAPAVFAAVVVVAALRFYGVPVVDVAVFGAYVALGVALPGLLLVRALYRGARTLALAEELALGLALGYAVEVPVYIAARAAGAPLLVLLWPLGTCAVFAAVPRLRGHFRGAARTREPAWYAWFLALLVVHVTAWSSFTFFRTTALTWPAAGTSLFDIPYHLALIGELKHHMPPTVPVVAGEPLLYHWFVYAHLAAASWVTGLEPLVLLFRLGMFPMLVAFVVLVGAVGHRVTGSRAGSALAVAGTVFVAVPSLYANANGLFTWTGVQHSAWESPTQTFGALLFAPVVLLLIDVLERRRRHGAGRWVLVAVLLAAVAGAKATYLPMLLAGLAALAAVEAARRRRPPWAVLGALATTAACLLYAHLVLFGGARQAMALDPLSLMRRTWGELTGLGEHAQPPPDSLAGITLLYAACWAVTWCGIAGLLARPRSLARPGTVLVLGVGAAGIGATVLLGGPALNQGYFLQGAYPYLAVAAAYGFLVAVRGTGVPRLALVGAAAAGVVLAHLVRVLSDVRVPLAAGRDEDALYRPFVALAVAVTVVVAAAVVLLVATGRRPRHRTPLIPLLIALVTAVGPLSAWHARALSIVYGTGENGVYRVSRPAAAEVPAGLFAAGRWLRAHSRPDELVATNAHCVWRAGAPCDSRHFWISALTERRVLVEGWAYTARNLDRWRPGESVMRIPFWDTGRLLLNEAVFTAPSAEAVRRLREQHGVRWLFVEEGREGVSPRIGEFATLRFRAADCAVYRLPDIPGAP